MTWTVAPGGDRLSRALARSPVDEHVDVRRGSPARRRAAGSRDPGHLGVEVRRSPRPTVAPRASMRRGAPGNQARPASAAGGRRPCARQPTIAASTDQIDGRLSAIERPARAARRGCRTAGRCWCRSTRRPDPARSRGHRLAEHADVGILLGQAVVAADPAVPAVVAFATRRLAVGHQPALLGLRSAGSSRPSAGRADGRPSGKPNCDRQAGRDLLPLAAAVGRAVYAAMVLLVEQLAAVRRPSRACGRTGRSLGRGPGIEVGADALVARLPGRATVARLERPDGGDADPHPIRVGGVGDDRVEDQAAVARLPLGPARVVRQALDVLPRRATVAAPEQAGRARRPRTARRGRP